MKITKITCEETLEIINGLPSYDLPLEIPRNMMDNVEFSSETVLLNDITTSKILNHINIDKTSFNDLLLSAIFIVQWKYSNSRDLLLGELQAGNTAQENEIRFFSVNISNEVKKNVSLKKLKTHIRDATLGYSIDTTDFLETASLENKSNINMELFSKVKMIYHLKDKSNHVDLKSFIQHNQIEIAIEMSIESSHTIYLTIHYNKILFGKEYSLNLSNHIINTIELLISPNHIALQNLDILTKGERDKLVYCFNQTENTSTKSYHSLDKLFENQVKLNSDKVAIIDNSKSLTYEQLNNESNKLAHMLINQGVKQNDFVTIIINRTVNAIIAILGIIKSGAAYVPIEPNYPISRIKHIFQSTESKIVITNDSNFDFVSGFKNEIISIKKVINIGIRKIENSYSYDDINKCSSNNININNFDRVAYTIFTSGTTGIPKGVVVKHDSVYNLINWVNTTYSINSNDRALSVSSLCFDLSVYDIFGMLAAGGSLYIASENEIRSPQLLNILCDNEITFWNSAPAVLQQFTPLFSKVRLKALQSKLRLVFLSGDWIPLSLPTDIKNAFKKTKVVSLGGATEATVWSNYYNINEIKKEWLSIPYGKPIDNSVYLILDDFNNPCPENVPGKLFIGGSCLASGYLDDKKLTDNKFILNPFNHSIAPILYKTGDYARWRSDGNIEFLGRKDSQVKINGYRIELGEIDSQLIKWSKITDVITLAASDTKRNRVLILFFSSNFDLSKDCIQDYLKDKLPNYMIPQIVIQIDKIPLTSNGKVDRNQLIKLSGFTT